MDLLSGNRKRLHLYRSWKSSPKLRLKSGSVKHLLRESNRRVKILWGGIAMRSLKTLRQLLEQLHLNNLNHHLADLSHLQRIVRLHHRRLN
jgi:hypothetical protein